MIRVRQHWVALVRPEAVVLILLAMALMWAAVSPQRVEDVLHISWESPPFVIEAFRFFYAYKYIFAAVPGVIAAAIISGAWSWWLMSYYEIDEYGLTYRTGPFNQNTIPLRAIQDIRKSTSFWGLIFGYGTLTVDSGRQEETLLYVPRIDAFIAALQGPAYR